MAATRKIVDYFVRVDDVGDLVTLEIRSQVTSPDVFTGVDLVQFEAESMRSVVQAEHGNSDQGG